MKDKKVVVIAAVGILALALITTLGRMNLFGRFMSGQYMDQGMYYPQPTYVAEPMPAYGGDMGGGYGEAKMMDYSQSYIEPDIQMIPPYYYGDDALSVEERVYERFADFSVIVKDVPAYLRTMREYVLSVDGVVLSDNYFQGDRYVSGTLSARIPVAHFQEMTNRATEAVKEVYSSNNYTNDVTGMHQTAAEQQINVQVRLNEVRARLEAAQKNLETSQEGSTAWQQYRTEVLNLESQVARLEAQLERLEQSSEQMEERVEYATVTLTAASSKRYFEPYPYGGGFDFSYQLERAFESLKRSGSFLATMLVWVVVYSVLWVPALVLYKWAKRRFNKMS